jgi:PAS domain S-box-containing protein
MAGEEKTTEELIQELEALRRKVAELQRAEEQRNRAEEALRASERRWRMLVKGLPRKVFYKDRDSVYVACNDNYARDLGIRADEIAGKTDYDFFPKKLADKYRSDDRMVMESGRTHDIEETYIHDGQERIIHTVKRPLIDADGDTIGILGIFEDITERNQVEEELRRYREHLEELVEERTRHLKAANAALERAIAERAHAEDTMMELNRLLADQAAELTAVNAELEAFAYSVSHDLQAPLRRIDGFSRILLEDFSDALDEEAKRYLNRVRAGAQQMGQLIDDILKLSRATRGGLSRETVDLSALALAAAKALREEEPDRDVQLVIAPGVLAQGDKRLLRVVMQNLLGNAWKFTRATARPRVEFGVTEKQGQRVYFVRDNGVGFDMAYAEKLFEPFQRLHSAAEFPGSGIGLAIVQRIIRRHGGAVWAEGAVGEGATLYFTLGGGYG